jgi:hypothetical protein
MKRSKKVKLLGVDRLIESVNKVGIDIAFYVISPTEQFIAYHHESQHLYVKEFYSNFKYLSLLFSTIKVLYELSENTGRTIQALTCSPCKLMHSPCKPSIARPKTGAALMPVASPSTKSSVCLKTAPCKSASVPCSTGHGPRGSRTPSSPCILTRDLRFSATS